MSFSVSRPKPKNEEDDERFPMVVAAKEGPSHRKRRYTFSSKLSPICCLCPSAPLDDPVKIYARQLFVMNLMSIGVLSIIIYLQRIYTQFKVRNVVSSSGLGNVIAHPSCMGKLCRKEDKGFETRSCTSSYLKLFVEKMQASYLDPFVDAAVAIKEDY